jgi:rhamnose transport system ATP-binding protein
MTVDRPSRPPETTAEAAARLHLAGVSKRFSAVPVIRNANITIRAGRLYVLVGENAAREATVLILDEPSAILTGREMEVLSGVVRRLTESEVSVIHILHRAARIRSDANSIQSAAQHAPAGRSRC